MPSLFNPFKDRHGALLSPREKRRLLVVGFLQVVPLVTGIILTESLPPLFFPLDYLLMGIIGYVIVAVLLGGNTPSPPIQSKHDRRT